MDQHKNFARSLVINAPSPATSGTDLKVTTNEGSYFPTPPFNATVWPSTATASPTNAEIVRVTGINGDTFTITRAQENTTARSIEAGDRIVATVTAKTITDIENSTSPFVTVGSANANYITDGTADDVQIQQALNIVNTAGGGTVFLKRGTYNVTSVMTIGSSTTIEGEEKASTIIKKVAAQNSTIFNNKDTTNGNSFIHIKNLTLNQQGASQSDGGGASFTGLFDSTIENVVIEKSYVFNLFVSSLAGTSLTGTLTFTNGDTTVSGSGTAFTTELSVGTIVKSAGGHFQRVASVTSNTSLELDRAWGWATESGVAGKKVPANARNRILNCTFNGTVGSSDNVGLGLFDDSLIQGCVSRDSTGYGFGPDHANRLKFIGNTCANNSNSGIGMETCGYCVVGNNEFYGNGNGIYILSGSYRNIVIGNECHQNTNGISLTYNSTSFPKPDENKILGNTTDLNTTHGIRIGGSLKTSVIGNHSFNNGNSGIVTVTESSYVPTDTLIQNNQCYDNQDTKTQQKGIWISGGSNTLVLNNLALDADHTSAGITDSGTNTIIYSANAGNVGVGTNNPGNKFSVNTPVTSAAAQALFAAGAAGNVPLAIEGHSSQSADLFQILSSAANVILNITSGGLVRAGLSSSASTPTFSFNLDADTGMYRPTGTANTLLFTAGGTDRLQLDSNGTTFLGALTLPFVAKTANYTVTASDSVLTGDCTSGNLTFTLPAAASIAGRRYTFKRIDGSGNSVIIDGNASETIDGATTYTLSSQYESVTIVSNGTNWLIV